MIPIAVIGRGRDCPRSVEDLAFDTGRALAEWSGVCLVNGGLGGAMAAAAEGAWRAGATTISLIPAGREGDAHQFATIALTTGLTEPFRNALLASAVAGALMLPGQWGTVQEATVLLDRGVPIVGVGEHDGFMTASLTVDVWEPDPTWAVRRLAMLVDAPDTTLDDALPADPPSP